MPHRLPSQDYYRDWRGAGGETNMQLTNYPLLLADIQIKIREAQVKATLSANAQMIRMYWDIGNMISQKQKIEGWGASVIAKLSKDLKSEMPELRGFSERNLKNMLRFANEYSFVQSTTAQMNTVEILEVIKMQLPTAQLKHDANSILQLPTAKLQSFEMQQNTIVQPSAAQLNKFQLLTLIPWTHNILLIEKIKDLETRFWYINQINENGWTVDNLSTMIKSKLHERNRSLVNNFDDKLPKFQSELVKQRQKDPYIFILLKRKVEKSKASKKLKMNCQIY